MKQHLIHYRTGKELVYVCVCRDAASVNTHAPIEQQMASINLFKRQHQICGHKLNGSIQAVAVGNSVGRKGKEVEFSYLPDSSTRKLELLTTNGPRF